MLMRVKIISINLRIVYINSRFMSISELKILMDGIKIADILHIKEENLKNLDKEMQKLTGKSGVIQVVEKDIEEAINKRLDILGLKIDCSAEDIIHALVEKLCTNEEGLYKYIGITRDSFDFEKLAQVAKNISHAKQGFFLKIEKAANILRKYPPEGTIKYLGYGNVNELLKKEDVLEVFSALRFTETTEWMHEMFEVVYSGFTAEDFEEREIELRMLGKQWEEIAKKFVEKKHHNVSHLKEFGVIFLNPINQTAKGALFRDFALFFHYFHEIVFYSNLFKKHSSSKNFAERLKSFLRGDVPELDSVGKGEWLIVQRYLWKENPQDPRLVLPRVNPEALHWHKGEQNLVEFGKQNPEVGLGFWDDLDWVAGYFFNKEKDKILVSFDLEDNAMSLVSAQQEAHKYIKYHQQEALWNELFRRYVGKEELDRLLVENFEKGIIKL